MYEVVWTRLLTQQMGQAVSAVATVLAAFMGGMAAGAVIGGSLVARRSPAQAARLYGYIEFIVAACALAVPAGLASLHPLLAAAYADGEGGLSFGIVRACSVVALLGVPAAALGATFPVASRWAIVDPRRRAGAAGGLYAANTLGAAAGAALASFILLPALGSRLTTISAASMTVAAGVIGVWAGTRTERPVTTRRRAPDAGRRRPQNVPAARVGASAAPAASTRPLAAAFAVAITGFVALAQEVAWTRVLALAIGPTTYAFGAMLSVFILGLAAGSWASAAVVDRLRRPLLGLAFVMILIGAASAATLPQVPRLPIRVAGVVTEPGVRFRTVLEGQAMMCAGLLLPLTIGLGAAFPLALRAGTADLERAPRDIAWIYAANTAGAIAGSLVGGFVLIPALGLERTLVTTSVACVAGGWMVLLAARVSRLWLAAGAVAAAAIAAIATSMPPWDPAVMTSGAYKYAPYVEAPDLESALAAGTLLYHRDGAASTVTVRRTAGVTSLAIDGKIDASNGGDMLTQKLLAHVPLLLHPRARRVAIVGLGSGVTLGAALAHPVERVDTIEISREVADAAALFRVENHDALADPRARLIIGDGRSHLQLTRTTYDVIISEPSNPWMAGVASLFTHEFFEAARRALSPDGVLCQWAHTYDITDGDLRSIVATFASVFPDGTMWLVGGGDLLIVGSPQGPLTARLDGIRAAFADARVAADLREVGVDDPAPLLSLFAGGPAELRTYAAGAPVQNDDRTALEFSAPRAIVGRSSANNAAVLRALVSDEALPASVRNAAGAAPAAAWRGRCRMELQAEAFDLAYDACARAVALTPADVAALDGLIDAASATRRQNAAVALLSSIAGRQPSNIAARVALSRLRAASGDPDGALETVRPLMALDDPRPAEQMASVLADAGDLDRLRPLAQHLQRRWPERPGSIYYAATVAFLEGRPSDAIQLAGRGVAVAPHDARFRTLVGASYAALGRRDDARRAFEDALRENPRDPVAYANLAQLDLESGDPDRAASRFAEALILESRFAPALRGLADALERGGYAERAARVARAAELRK